jgi:hypothetical protein
MLHSAERVQREAPQRRNILAHKQGAKRKHPQAENRQEAKDSTCYQSDAKRQARPSRRRPNQP